MAAMKPRTGDGPMEAVKEGRLIIVRVPLEGGGRLVVSVNDDEAKELYGVLGEERPFDLVGVHPFAAALPPGIAEEDPALRERAEQEVMNLGIEGPQNTSDKMVSVRPPSPCARPLCRCGCRLSGDVDARVGIIPVGDRGRVRVRP